MAHFESIARSDEKLWERIFSDSEIPEDMKARLRYMKDVGTRIIPDPDFGYRLQPIIGAKGWESMEQYDQEKECLLKYRAIITHVFKMLRREVS